MLFFETKKNKLKRKIIITFSSLFVVGVIFLFPVPALAQGVDAFYGGGAPGVTEESLRQTTGLGSTDPRVVAARVIQIALGFLGIITVSLIIYGGWMYMTSEGNEEKITKAKAILKNAVIGLIIILSAFSIASFILGRLTDGRATHGGPGAQGGPGFQGGFGAVGACSVESVFPEDMAKEVPRNTSIIITFKEEINPATVCSAPVEKNNITTCDGSEIATTIIQDKVLKNFRIYPQNQRESCDSTSQTACAGAKVYSNDNKTFVFVPDSYLGSASEYIWYEIYATNDIQVLATGKGVFSPCRNSEFLSWMFEVSNKLDLTPPQVKSIFPAPDNWQDEFFDTGIAVSAKGTITVDRVPQVEASASHGSPVAGGGSPDLNVSGTYTCAQDGILSLSVSNENNFLASGISGAISTQPISGGQATVCGLNFSADDGFSSGNSWTLSVTAVKTADKLNVDGTLYTFVDSSPANNQIQIGNDANSTASNIASALNNRTDVNAISDEKKVNITARVSGLSGNNIILASDSSALVIDSQDGNLYGGTDRSVGVNINGRKDQPKNATIQINFNKAMMPTTISGTAEQVKDYIRVVNVDSEELLSGRFEISNMYRTIEFIPDNACGVNACGGKVYCLPGNSNLQVEIEAAPLVSCVLDSDCASRNPYNKCVGSACQTEAGINYPQGALTGALDASMNSLDGNRDGNAQGPVSYYDENALYGLCDNGRVCTGTVPQGSFLSQINCSSRACAGASNISGDSGMQTRGDRYQWSFFISDELDLKAPAIISTSPGKGGSDVNLSEPIRLEFDKLLRSSSLRTGGKFVVDERDDSDDSQVPHKYLNLWSYDIAPMGYWITKEDVDDPADNNPDFTVVYINHGMFSDAIIYRAQAGSGIEDIYQNCFLPSRGPACVDVDEGSPSCCNGEVTDRLGDLGNCP
jgi:hypothetical protein